MEKQCKHRMQDKNSEETSKCCNSDAKNKTHTHIRCIEIQLQIMSNIVMSEYNFFKTQSTCFKSSEKGFKGFLDEN